MNKSEFTEVISASLEKIWEVLFQQYGDIHIHNPTMVSSNYMNSASIGTVDCSRRCMFNDKLYVEEVITEVDENTSFKVVVTDHNLPFLKEMSAVYELTSINNEETEVKMISYTSSSPGLMIYLMRGQLGKSLKKHLFGMRYYIETGKIVDMNNYSKVFKSYK